MNIPANRKAKIRIIIEDKNGNPIGNEKMHIDLQKHKCCSDAVPLTSTEIQGDDRQLA